MKQTELTTDEIIEQLVKFTAQIAQAVAELVQRTEVNPGPFGDDRPKPTATEYASELLLKAIELQLWYSEDSGCGAAPKKGA
jgi:hypothetical protein